MPSLFVIQGHDQGKRFELTGDLVCLGRGQENPIQLHDTEVSRRHAEFRWDGEAHGYCLVDLGSSNGTFVNHQRVDSHPLQTGDRLQVGRSLMIYTGLEDATLARYAGTVDILPLDEQSESRIVRAIGQEDYDNPDPSSSESLWLARARSNLQVMYRTALAVSHTMDIDDLLHRILELIFEWVEADRGCVMLQDRATGQLAPQVRYTRPGLRTDDTMFISRTILDYVTTHREGVLTSDARDDERWDAGGSILRMGVREAICVPMQGRYGNVGIIYIDTYTAPGALLRDPHPRKFSEEHLKLMIAIGHQAALAVEDTSYYGALVQAERLAAIGQTIAGLSHHIKNILQGIRGGGFLIEEGLRQSDTEIVQKGWRIVDRNQEKISRLVLDMLTFSKSREPEMIAARLGDVVADVLDVVRLRTADRNIELAVDLPANLPELIFDPEGIHHALLNIVTNAIDACESREDGARVEVSVVLDTELQMVGIHVRDNGEGIPAEMLPRIFQLFESTKGSRGTGLGLSVSQKILQEHGGRIRVESRTGEGSVFYLEFPFLTNAEGANAEGGNTGRANAERGSDGHSSPPLPMTPPLHKQEPPHEERRPHDARRTSAEPAPPAL